VFTDIIIYLVKRTTMHARHKIHATILSFLPWSFHGIQAHLSVVS